MYSENRVNVARLNVTYRIIVTLLAGPNFSLLCMTKKLRLKSRLNSRENRFNVANDGRKLLGNVIF